MRKLMHAKRKLIPNAGLLFAFVLSFAAPARAELKLTEAEAKQAAVARPMPDYPAMARQLNITGKIELEVLVGVDGKVTSVKIISGNPVLTKACAKAAAEWKFRPFLKSGVATQVSAPLTFEFR